MTMRRVLVGWCYECLLVYEPWVKGQVCASDEHVTRGGNLVKRRGLRRVWLWECSVCAVNSPEASWFRAWDQHDEVNHGGS